MKMLPKSIYQISYVLVLIILGSCNSRKENEKGHIDHVDQIGNDGGFIDIFDGKSLDGWDGDSTFWRVEDGNLVGEVTPSNPLKNNTFIIWQGGEPADFELKGEFKITGEGNSGINY